MPARPRRDPTDDWEQLFLLVTSPEQEAYEILRPIVLFGQPTGERAQETRTAERTLRRAVARFETAGMRSLFDPEPPPPSSDRRLLPTGIRAAIVGLKAEYPSFGPDEVCQRDCPIVDTEQPLGWVARSLEPVGGAAPACPG